MTSNIDPNLAAAQLIAASVSQNCRSMDDAAKELSRKGLEETPMRMAAAMAELLGGYDEDPEQHLKMFPLEGDAGMVVVRDLPFASVCEHHVLPFTGTASVVYIPTTLVVGLSKIPRILHTVSRRLQMQERIGQQVADALYAGKDSDGVFLSPKGVMVVVRARHTCMALRGVRSSGEMVTSCIRGVFATDAAARAEAMELMRGG